MLQAPSLQSGLLWEHSPCTLGTLAFRCRSHLALAFSSRKICSSLVMTSSASTCSDGRNEVKPQQGTSFLDKADDLNAQISIAPAVSFTSLVLPISFCSLIGVQATPLQDAIWKYLCRRQRRRTLQLHTANTCLYIKREQLLGWHASVCSLEGQGYYPREKTILVNNISTAFLNTGSFGIQKHS